MNPYPAVIVHGIVDARAALAAAGAMGRPVTLVSAPGAALHAGVAWWRALAIRARAEHPQTVVADILDCGAAPAYALDAIRLGQRVLVLAPCSIGFAAIAAIAAQRGVTVLTAPPAAFDMRGGPRPGRVAGRRGVTGGGSCARRHGMEIRLSGGPQERDCVPDRRGKA